MATPTRQYETNQYGTSNDYVLDTGFTCYDRLLVELNRRMYYSDVEYKKFLNENGLVWDELYDKNRDHAQLLETVYSILQTLLANIDMYRKVETEFVTQGEAANALQARLKSLRAEIDRIKAEMHYEDSDFSFMYYTR